MDLNTITSVVRPDRREGLPPWQSGDALLAGGTWLFSEPQPQLSRLIDLTTLGWTSIDADAQGLHIAATCTIARLEGTPLPAEWTAAPLISQCCRAFVASFKIWNTATVGGNLCMALPAGPMISLAAALDGMCTVWSRDGGERQMPVMDFVTGARRTALKPGDILRQIDLPAATLTRRAASRQASLTPHGRSAALLIGTMSRDGAFDLTITAATARPMRLSFPKQPGADELKQRIEDMPHTAYFDDVHGSPLWRRHMTAVLAEEIRAELAGESGP